MGVDREACIAGGQEIGEAFARLQGGLHLGFFGAGAQTLDRVDELVVAATPGIDVEALKLSAIAGALAPAHDAPVNAINAPGLAQEQGWTVATRSLPEDDEQYLRIRLSGDRDITLEGTYTPHYGLRVTNLAGFDVEFRPKGRFLFTKHDDVPGVLARITALLAESEVNVANVSLARNKTSGQAVAVIRVDGSIPAAARDGLRELKAVHEAHRIRL